MNCSTPGFLVLQYIPEFGQTHIHWINDAIQPSHPLSPPFPASPQSSPASVFSNGLTLCIRWPKYWSFSFSISPSKEYSGLISFRMDWFNLFAVQGTLKSLLQHHSSKASILQHSAFFRASLVAQRVKRLPTMQETWVQSLGWEDPLEKEMATTPVLLPGKSHGRKSLIGYSPWGRKELDTTEWLHFHFQPSLLFSSHNCTWPLDKP